MCLVSEFPIYLLCLLPFVVRAQNDAYLPLSDGKLLVRRSIGFIPAYSEPHAQSAWVLPWAHGPSSRKILKPAEERRDGPVGPL